MKMDRKWPNLIYHQWFIVISVFSQTPVVFDQVDAEKKSKNYIQIKHEHLFFLFEILPLQSRIKRDAEERGKSNHPALLISFNSEQTNTTNREQNGEQAEPVSLTDISVKDSNAIKYRRRRFSLNHWRTSVDVPD